MDPLALQPVTCFGEILWDILPGAELPGGAPMNVAYHLKKLGVFPTLISRVGLDDYGKRLLELLGRNGLPSNYVQEDKDHATGLVYARPGAHHEVSYDIVFPSAWDFIEWREDFPNLLAQSGYFIYGSLAARHEVSRHTLYRLLEAPATKVLDINLRPPHFDRPGLEYLIQKADILKMNSGELELVAGWFAEYKKLEDKIRKVQDQYNINTVLVTMGGDGALIAEGGTIYRHPGFPVKVADTIGSGDAFLAGYVYKKLRGASPEMTLEFASGMGAFIATQPGACPAYEPDQVTALISTGAPAGE